TLKFDCGCEFEIIKNEKNPAGLPCLNIDYEQILYDLNYGKHCPKVWEILGEGKTKGVFQLESYLGQNWCIKLKPTCIDDMAALAALIRPSCLDSMVDGKNLAQHYVDRKHNVEPAKPIHPALEDLLASTQQIILFQEDSIRIAVDVAGFTEEEADLLRKAIGEKKPDLMAKAKAMFIEGCKKVNKVTEKEALNIFNIIEASQRYCVTGDTLFRRVGEPPISVANLYLEKDRSQYSLSLCADGRIRRNKVFDVIYEGKQEVLKIELENGYSCKVTPSHRFPLSYEEEIEAKDLKVGDYLLCGSTGKYPIYQSTITKITPLEEEDVYTISMYPPNHTYLINEGIITSNCFNKANATSYGMLGKRTDYI